MDLELNPKLLTVNAGTFCRSLRVCASINTLYDFHSESNYFILLIYFSIAGAILLAFREKAFTLFCWVYCSQYYISTQLLNTADGKSDLNLFLVLLVSAR
jgi:hypothetical protein